MAFEHKNPDPISFPANSTGLKAKRFCVVNGSGKVAYPALGVPVDGVMITSSTGSTADNQPIAMQFMGVARVQAQAASTLSVGDLIAASSEGRIVVPGAGGNTVGRIVEGSSGSSNRILSVLLMPIGTT